MEDEDEQAAKATKEVSALKLAAQFNLHSRSKAPPITRVQFQRETKKRGPFPHEHDVLPSQDGSRALGRMPPRQEPTSSDSHQSSSESDDNDLGPSATMVAAAHRRRKDRLEGSMKSTFFRSALEKEVDPRPVKSSRQTKAKLEEMEQEAERHQEAKKRRVQTVRQMETELEKKEAIRREKSAAMDGPSFIATSRRQYFDKMAHR